MEGQKEYRRRITKLHNAKTNTTENNTVIRIQNKVRVLLQSRSQDFNSRVLVAAAGAAAADDTRHDMAKNPLQVRIGARIQYAYTKTSVRIQIRQNSVKV